MAKRRMGDAAQELFTGATAADALAEVTGAKVEKGRPARVPARGRSAAKKADAKNLRVANVRLAERHMKALQKIARRRAADAGYTRADASAVLREVLDAWLDAKKWPPTHVGG